MSEDVGGSGSRAGSPKRRSGRSKRSRGKRRRRPPESRSRSSSGGGTLGDLLSALSRELRGDADPMELLSGSSAGELELKVRVPLDPAAAGDVGLLRRRLDEARADLIAKQRIFRSGRVVCLRCSGTDCEHGVVPNERSVFAGYLPTGLPRWVSWDELLLERRDTRVDQLHQHSPGFVVSVVPLSELVGSVLDAYRPEDGFRVWGQVDAGWFVRPRFPDDRQALSLQVISVRGLGREWRFGLKVLGTAPGGEELETRLDSWGELPWGETVRWGQGILRDVENAANNDPDPESMEAGWPARVTGLPGALARRLEKLDRSDRRKTLHAQDRQRQQRPTGKALADLGVASDGQILFDLRNETLVVLGERGRAHVFAQDGRLVTSIQYTSASIARRREGGTWRSAAAGEIAGLRALAQKLAGESPADREGAIVGSSPIEDPTADD